MTAKPKPPSSGNPAKQAQLRAAAQSERAAERQEKLQEYKRLMAKRKRSRGLIITIASIAAIVVVGVIVASFMMAPRPDTSARTIVPTPEANAFVPGTPTIDGVETFSYGSLHTSDKVEYAETPPAGGPHTNEWLTCTVYTEPQKNENAVHSMEHGAIWITYDPALVSEDDIKNLQQLAPSSYAIVSPYPDMGNPVTISGWNVQLKVDSTDDARLGEFIEQYWQSQHVPEPGASCNGVTGPGVV